MYQRTILQLICGLLIFLFVYTASSKLLHFQSFQLVLSRSPLLHNLSRIIAWGLPLGELFISGLLFFEKTRSIGLYASLTTLVLFTLYILYMLLFIPRLPCSCGGVLQQLTWKQHCFLNLFFTGLCGVGLLIQKRLVKIPPEWSPMVPYPNKEDIL
jgi:putative oxidoreductase